MSHTFDTWTTENLKSQNGKTVLITGANSGIGFFTTLAFAKAGAHVIVAGRNFKKVDTAIS